MSNSFVAKKVVFIINIIYTFILFIIFYLLVKYALPLILPFLIATGLSYIAEPYVGLLIKKAHFKRCYASVIVILCLLIVAGVVFVLLSASFVTGIKQLIEVVPEVVENIDDFADKMLNENGLDNVVFLKTLLVKIRKADLSELLQGSVGNGLLKSISKIMSSVPNLFLTTLITLVSSIFISSSFSEFKTFIIRQFSQHNKNLIFDIKKTIFSTVKSYFKTYITLMLLTFAELTVLFLIFNIRPAASIALIISAVDILPVLGIGTVLIPWALAKLITGDTTYFFIIMAIYILVTVIRQIVEPKVIGNNTGLHPLIALISIYVGLKLFGVLGVFLAPISLIVISDIQRKGYIKLWK